MSVVVWRSNGIEIRALGHGLIAIVDTTGARAGLTVQDLPDRERSGIEQAIAAWRQAS